LEIGIDRTAGSSSSLATITLETEKNYTCYLAMKRTQDNQDILHTSYAIHQSILLIEHSGITAAQHTSIHSDGNNNKLWKTYLINCGRKRPSSFFTTDLGVAPGHGAIDVPRALRRHAVDVTSIGNMTHRANASIEALPTTINYPILMNQHFVLNYINRPQPIWNIGENAYRKVVDYIGALSPSSIGSSSISAARLASLSTSSI
jgi:hypothetical protein